MTLWQGRFGGHKQSAALFAFTESLSFDRRLAGDDITCSRAHVLGLERSGLLSMEETATLLEALATAEQELAEGTFVFEPATKMSTLRSNGVSPRSRARLVAGSTRGAAATTRLPPTCGYSPSARWPRSPGAS